MAKKASSARGKGPGKKATALRSHSKQKGGAAAHVRLRDVVALVDAVFTRRDPVGQAVELLDCERPTVRARVWERLLEYKYGRPAQKVVASGPGGGPVRVVIVSHVPRPRRDKVAEPGPGRPQPAG